MSRFGTHHTHDFLEAFSAEILRWNRRINLVSRQDTEELLKDLFAQSLEGGKALWGFLEESGWLAENEPRGLVYFDLGSGGGIPGAIWHCLFSGLAEDLRTWLVEPREKRAWFLDRVSGLEHTEPFMVNCGRWGEVEKLLDGDTPSTILVSMKALHLTDAQVLAGLAKAAPSLVSAQVVVARYYPAGQVLDQKLVNHLGITPEEELVSLGHLRVRGSGSRILTWSRPGPRDACLVLSLYK